LGATDRSTRGSVGSRLGTGNSFWRCHAWTACQAGV